jgi:hypothetical protein
MHVGKLIPHDLYANRSRQAPIKSRKYFFLGKAARQALNNKMGESDTLRRSPP